MRANKQHFQYKNREVLPQSKPLLNCLIPLETSLGFRSSSYYLDNMNKKAKIYLVHVYAFTPLMIAVCQRNFIDPSLELQPHQQDKVYIYILFR